jgi:hypothetical protein
VVGRPGRKGACLGAAQSPPSKINKYNLLSE